MGATGGRRIDRDESCGEVILGAYFCGSVADLPWIGESFCESQDSLKAARMWIGSQGPKLIMS